MEKIKINTIKGIIFILTIILIIPLFLTIVEAGPAGPPQFTVAPNDYPDPVTQGNDVTFNATAEDPKSTDWYLIICKGNAVNPGPPPTCPDGAYCISTLTAHAATANCTWTADVSGSWWGFPCDSLVDDGCGTVSNTNSPITVETGDASPNVTLNSPENYYNTSEAITFNCTASDDINLVNVSLYGNWTVSSWHLNDTNTPANDTPTTFVKTINDGTYVWNCQACDNKTATQCEFAAENRTFTVDATAPIVVSLDYPGNNSVINSGLVDFNFTATDNLGLANCTLYTDFTGGWAANETVQNPANDTQTNITVDPPEGTYIWNILCYDNLANPDWYTNNYTVIIDETNPTASFETNPVDNYNSSSQLVIFELSCSDNYNVSTLQLWGNWTGIWHANQTNSSPINATTWTIQVDNIPEGKGHIWGVWCNDSVSNSNWTDTNRTFTVDITAPIITVVSPLSQNYTTTTIDFNVSLNENTDWCGFSLDEAANVTMTKFNNTYFNYTNSSMTQGQHNITFSCNDTLGNMNASAGLIYFTVDSQGPILINEGANETNISQNEWFCLNITATDSPSGVDTVYAEVWNTTHLVNYTMNDTGTSCGGGEDNVYGVEIHGTAQGIWNYSKAHANDTLNNWNSSDFSDLTINVTAPSDANYPQFSNPQEDPINDSNYLFGQAYQFNSTITYTNGTVSLNFNGTNYSASNDTATNFYVDITSLSAETYNYYWWGYGNGSQNNYNSSSTRAYVVQKENPDASLENNESWTVTYPTIVKINYSESNDGDGNVVYKVYRDNVDKGSGETILLGNGTYNYVLNTTGGTNYTSNSSIDVETFIVNQNTGSCGVLFNETSPINYSTIFRVWTNCTSGFVLYRNETPIENNSPQNLAADTYNFTVIRNDTVNYSNYYEEREFVVQQAIGEVYAWIDNQQSNKSVLLYSEKWLNATLNAGDSNVNCNLYYNNTLIEGGTCPLANLTNFTQIGEFNVTAFYDGNENWTNDYETWWVNVTEDSPPTVNIVYPDNITYNTNVTQLNYTADDDISLSHCWYSLNGGGTNLTPDATCSNYTDLTSIEGSNNWTVYANDSTNQIGSDIVFFTKDTVPPSVTINSPLNQTYNTNSTLFNVTATDITTSVNSCWYSLDAGVNNNSMSQSGDYWTDTNSSMTQNSHTVNFYCNDSYNNVNDTEQEIFFIDSIYPLIDYESETPSNNSNLSQNFIYVNVTWTEDNFKNVTYRLYNSTSEVDVTTYTSEIYEINWTPLSNEVYTYNVTIIDIANNVNTTETRTITLDTIYPTINIVYPENDTYAVNVTDLNYTVDDDISLSHCWYSLNGGETNSSPDATCSNYTDLTSIEGSNTWAVYANDTAGNENSTSVTFNKDTAYPQFSNPQENPINDSNYLFGQAYQFNSTITYTNGTIFLNFNNTNYSTSNISDEFYVDMASLSAETYNYYWWGYGNGTNKNYNSSDTRAYVVQKANPDASLTNVTDPWTVTYPEEVTINYSESNNGDGNVVYKVYRDNVDKGSGETVTLGYGDYEYILNTTGGTNYTSNSSLDNQTLIVNQNTGSCSVLFNESSPINYSTIFRVWTNCSTSGFVLYRNETPIENNSPQNLAASTYNFTVIRNDTVNYSNYYDEREFVVQQATPVLTKKLNTADDNLSINYPTEVNASASTTGGTVNIYRNETEVTNENNINVSLAVNYYEYEFNVTGNENYTDVGSVFLYATVNKGISEVATYIDETRGDKSVLLNNERFLNATLITGQAGENITLYYNDTLIEQGPSPLYNLTNFSVEGVWNITSIYDGNENYTADTETWWVTVSTDSAPTINIIYPENISYNFSVTQLNYTVDDDIDVSHCWYSLDGGLTNSTPSETCSNYTSLVSIEGSNNWTVYANDSTNQIGLDIVFFTKDTTYPAVTINSPLNQTYNTNSTLFNITATDTTTSVNSCWYSLTAGSYNYSMAQSGDYWTDTNSSMTQNSHTVNFYCNDTAGNVNDTKQETFFIDSIYPLINYEPETPSNNSNLSQNYIYVNVTWTEDNFKNVTYRLYNSTSEVDVTTYTSEIYEINWTPLSNEVYTYNVTIIDIANNVNTTETRTITLDTIYPTFSNYLRNPDPPNEDEDVQVNVTITETNLDTVILEWDGTTNYTVSTNISNEYYFTIAQGNYSAHDSVTYYWYANDTAINMNKSAQQGFPVANQIPSVLQPAINDTEPETNDILNCTGGDFSDNDEYDSEGGREFKWYDNDTEVSGQTSQTLDLSVSDLDKGDIIKCSIRVNDSYNWSNWTNSSNTATIQNSPPVITNPLTTVSWNANGTPYNYDYEATDADSGDTLTWYDNTTLFNISSTTGEISDIPTEDEAGTYSIRINVSDGNGNVTDDFTYTINDTTSPSIDFQPPTEEDESQLTRNYIQVNVTASDGKAIDTITVRLYNSTSLVQTNTSLISPYFVNFTNLPDENYYFNATVNDTSGNPNQTGTRTVSTDTGPPTINYVSPTEDSGAYKSQNYVEVNVTAGDPNLDKIVIRLYNSSHIQIDSAITSSPPNFANFTGLSNGLYYYNATANDTFGNDDSLTTRNITLDTIVPLIDFTTGTEDNDTTHSRNWIFVNVTVIEDNEDTITFSLYNQTTLVNETSYTNQQRTINWTGLPNEIYYYNVSINDTAGNSNSTVTNTIILDTEGPQVSLLTEYPDDPANYSEGGIYMFNATVTDPSLDVVWVDFNGTNYTATNFIGNIYNITLINLGIGTYDYRWYANDSFSNLNDSENGTYTIDQGTPSLGLTITPSNNEDYPTQTTADGTGCPSQLTCNLYRDGIEVTEPEVVTLRAETYNYTYNTTGNANYTSASVSNNLTINQATGVVFTYVNNSQSNITIEQYTEIYLNSTLETGQAGENITLYYNDTLIEQGPSPLYNLTNFTTIGLYNITTIYDGNENYTSAYETWWVNVTEFDATPPQISVIYPVNNTNYNSIQTQLNYTAWDNFGLNECWYSINGGQNETITCGNNVTGLDSGQGSSTWIVYANDSKGNENSSSVIFFVDSINPTIQFVDTTETNSTTFGRNYIQVNVTASDTNLANITIRLYNSTSLVQTNISSISPFDINYTGLSAETYYFNATANDTLGNNISTETRTVFLVLPNLTIIKPENETYITIKNLLLNYIVSYEDYVRYNIDNTDNTTISGNITFNTTETQHTLYLYANNTLGTTSKNVTFNINSSKFTVRYNNYAGSEKGNSTNFNQSSFEDLQNLSEVILENTDYGKISFNETINMTDDANLSDNEVDLDSYTNISSNHIEINVTALPNLNKSSTLHLYNLNFSNPRILRNNEICDSAICTRESYSPSIGTLRFTVTQFTTYSAEETPVEPVTPSGPAGVGGGAECFNNSECEPDEICWKYVCVKLFDIKIIDFESPAKLGDFFDFTYFIKGMANINDDVEVRFWIEKDGEKVSSGSDVIYLGSFEEKTETTKIFLPSNIRSGIYDFYVEVVHQDYTAKSHRTIEIQVREGIAIIGPIDTKGIGIFVLIFALFLFVLILFIIFRAERKKIKKFLLKDEKWIKKHKLSVIALLLIIILVALLYLSNLFEPIINLVLKIILWFKLQILPNLIYIAQIVLIIVLLIIFFIIAHKKKWLEKLEIKIKKRKKKKLRKKKYKAKVRKAKAEVKKARKPEFKPFIRIKKNIKSLLDFLDEKISLRIKRTREEKRIRKRKKESIRKKRRLEKKEKRGKRNRAQKRKQRKQRRLKIKEQRKKARLQIKKEKLRKKKRGRKRRRKSLIREKWERIKERRLERRRAREERRKIRRLRKEEIRKKEREKEKRKKSWIKQKWKKIKERWIKKRKAREKKRKIRRLRKEEIRKKEREKEKRKKSWIRKKWEEIRERRIKKRKVKREKKREKLKVRKEEISKRKIRKSWIKQKWEEIKQKKLEKKRKLQIREAKLRKEEIIQEKRKPLIVRIWEKTKEKRIEKKREERERKKTFQVREEKVRKEEAIQEKRKPLILAIWEKIKQKRIEKKRKRKEKKRKLQIRKERLRKEEVIQEKRKPLIVGIWEKIKENIIKKRKARKEKRKGLQIREKELRKEEREKEKRRKSLLKQERKRIREQRIKKRKARKQGRERRKLKREYFIKKRIPIIIRKIKSRIKRLKYSVKRLPEKIPETKPTKIDAIGFATKLKIKIKKIEKSLRDSLSEFKKIKISRPKTELPRIIPKFNLKKKWEKIKEKRIQKSLERRQERQEKRKIGQISKEKQRRERGEKRKRLQRRKEKIRKEKLSKEQKRKYLIKQKWEKIKERRLKRRQERQEKKRIRRLRREKLREERGSKIKRRKDLIKQKWEKIKERRSKRKKERQEKRKIRQIRKEKQKKEEREKEKRTKFLVKRKWEKIKEKRIERKKARKERRERRKLKREYFIKKRIPIIIRKIKGDSKKEFEALEKGVQTKAGEIRNYIEKRPDLPSIQEILQKISTKVKNIKNRLVDGFFILPDKLQKPIRDLSRIKLKRKEQGGEKIIKEFFSKRFERKKIKRKRPLRILNKIGAGLLAVLHKIRLFFVRIWHALRKAPKKVEEIEKIKFPRIPEKPKLKPIISKPQPEIIPKPPVIQPQPQEKPQEPKKPEQLQQEKPEETQDAQDIIEDIVRKERENSNNKI